MCILPFEISSFNMKMCESVFESHCKRQCIHIFIHTGNKKFKLQKEDDANGRKVKRKKSDSFNNKIYVHRHRNKSKIKKII